MQCKLRHEACRVSVGQNSLLVCAVSQFVHLAVLPCRSGTGRCFRNGVAIRQWTTRRPTTPWSACPDRGRDWGPPFWRWCSIMVGSRRYWSVIQRLEPVCTAPHRLITSWVIPLLTFRFSGYDSTSFQLRRKWPTSCNKFGTVIEVSIVVVACFYITHYCRRSF